MDVRNELDCFSRTGTNAPERLKGSHVRQDQNSHTRKMEATREGIVVTLIPHHDMFYLTCAHGLGANFPDS